MEALVAPVLDLPPWVARAFLLALIIGFPVALIFAWIVQLSSTQGENPATGTLDWFIAAALVAVLAALSYQQLTQPPAAKTAQQVTITPAPQTQGISIAVLPFANLSGDPSQEFFSDGMTEEIGRAHV